MTQRAAALADTGAWLHTVTHRRLAAASVFAVTGPAAEHDTGKMLRGMHFDTGMHRLAGAWAFPQCQAAAGPYSRCDGLIGGVIQREGAARHVHVDPVFARAARCACIVVWLARIPAWVGGPVRAGGCAVFKEEGALQRRREEARPTQYRRMMARKTREEVSNSRAHMLLCLAGRSSVCASSCSLSALVLTSTRASDRPSHQKRGAPLVPVAGSKPAQRLSTTSDFSAALRRAASEPRGSSARHRACASVQVMPPAPTPTAA